MKIGGFIIIAIGLITIMNHMYIKQIEEKKLIFREQQTYLQFLAENKMITYGFFGDSHTQMDINPNMISFSYNFGSSGEDYVETLVKIRNMQERNVTLEYAVLQLDMHQFSERFRKEELRFTDKWFYARNYPIKDIAAAKEKNIINIWASAHMPILGKGEEIINYILSEKNTTDISKGWTNSSEDFSKRNQELIASTKIKQHFGEGLFEEKSFSAFLESIKYLQEKGVKIILIAYPVTNDYENLMTEKEVSREEFYAVALSAVNNITTQYQLLDYHDVFFGRPELFADSDHLNYHGAEELAKLIASDLQSKEAVKVTENIPRQKAVGLKEATNATPIILLLPLRRWQVLSPTSP